MTVHAAENVLCQFWTGKTYGEVFQHYLGLDKNNPMRFSHYLAQYQENHAEIDYPVIEGVEHVHKIHRDPERLTGHPGLPLPTPTEQMGLVILWLGKQPAGQWCYPKYCRGEAIIGAVSDDNFEFIIDGLSERNLIGNRERKTDSRDPERKLTLRLTLRSWDRFRELKRGKISGDKAIMAMKFVKKGDPLHDMYETHFKRAAKEAGFELYDLREDAKAGLIDNHLRVAIQTAAFVISDLSPDNLGAYWEAGYAEGLGKSVIYTCRQHEGEKLKTHFDTNNHTTIIWDENNPAKAADDLKATIRNSLPHLAKMEDDQ